MFIKICGLSTLEALEAASDADAVGFILAPGYARTIAPEQVAALLRQVGEDVVTVGVFRNQGVETVLEGASAAGVQVVQLHGDEPLEVVHQVEAAGFKVWRAFSANAFANMSAGEREFWAERRILLDAVTPGEGVPFDPRLLAEAHPEGDWLLAGGLNSSNVGELVNALGPTGVDVSSGVEVSRGVKSPQLITEFIRTVRNLPK